MSSKPVDYIPILTEIRNQMGYIDRNIRKVQAELAPAQLHSVRRFFLEAPNKWYPFNMPPSIKRWYLHITEMTATVKLGYGTTTNLQEEQPLNNYVTIDPAFAIAPPLLYAIAPHVLYRETSPNFIWLNTDKATWAEVEVWT